MALTPVVVGFFMLTTGCQSLMRSAGLDSGAKQESHEAVRTLLSTGQYETALERIGPEGDAAPTDVALWLLYRGTVAYHAGLYAESAEALDLAHYVSEARYTRRLGTGALSLITNDRVLPYVPDRTERLLIHYYAALDYLMLDQPLEAAVEARRLSFMLERYAEEPPLRDHPDLVAHMRLVAGLVFRAAGEENDAAVAFRLAYAAAEGPDWNDIFPTLATEDPSGASLAEYAELDDLLPARSPDGATEMSPDSTGEVIVLVERGFISPRVQEDVDLALWEHELEAVSSANFARRASVATCIAEYVLRNADPFSLQGRIDVADDETERCVPVPDDWDERQTALEEKLRDQDDTDRPDNGVLDGHALPVPRADRPPDATQGGRIEPPVPRSPEDLVRGPAAPAELPASRPDHGTARGPEREYIRLALPTYRPSVVGPRITTAVLSAGGMDPLELALPIDLSACVTEEFAAEVPFLLAKTITRSAVRYAVARGLEAGARNGGDALGEVIGFLADAAGDALERADTRSWQLLPASLGVVRLRLPVGEHPISLSAYGDVAPGCDLGTVRVEAGRTPILACRVWH